MKKEWLNFLKELLETPSPSGFEQPVQEVFRKFVKPYADNVKTDVHGNTIAFKKGKGKMRVMLAGHVDEIGLMVKYIDDRGFIRFSAIGIVDYALTAGERVNIYHGNKVVRGVVGVRPIHTFKGFERDKPITPDELWIDVGAQNKKEAEKIVSVGDCITFSPGIDMLPNNIIASKATDNKVGVFTAAAVLSNLANETINANIYSVSTVQEEIGARGAGTSAFGIDPHIGIAIDVTPAIDHPTVDKNIHGDINLNGGVAIAVGANINPRISELLKAAANETRTKHQIEPIPGAAITDALTLQISRAGVATGILSIPNRYIHTPSEMVSLTDIEGAVTLLTQFCKMIDDDTNLIP